MINIIGVSAGYHDSACCILQDGKLVAAAQEERFTRLKNDRSLPRHSFRYCLKEAGLTISDIDCIAFYENPKHKLSRQLWMATLPALAQHHRDALSERFFVENPVDALRRLFGFEKPIEIVDHHLSHAASSYLFSGFDEAAILTADGVGEWPTTTYNSGDKANILRLDEVEFPHSLGLFYSALTSYLGFEVNEGEYKVMGLAPYGRPIYTNRLRKLISSTPDGQYRLDLRYFGFLTSDRMYTDEFVELLGGPAREPEHEILEFHMDIASSAQSVLEEILLEKVSYLHKIVPSENLCLAGGVALNVVATSRCLRDGPFSNLFVQPAAGDAGGCLGAAAVAHTRLTGSRPDKKRMSHVYLGPANSPDSIYAMLKATSVKYLDFRSREAELLQHVVGSLTEGKVVGWCQGRMEFGPRALGARSILADPRRQEMKNRINEIVKMREAFRPFAPAVLADCADLHFDIDHASPFMLETCTVISPIKLPAITHVDGSARLQTVDRASNWRFAALLEEFYRNTGCPVLLNTSFNVRGEPIVCTAIDAIRSFTRTRMDLLVLEDFIIKRSDIPPLWELEASELLATRQIPRENSVGHLIYTSL